MGRNLQAERLRDAQLQRAFLRLGTDDPACFICGERRPEVLELHHVAGRRFTDDTVVLCRNCHGCVSDPSHDQRIPHDDIPEARFVEGLAELLNERARWLRDHKYRRMNVAPHG